MSSSLQKLWRSNDGENRWWQSWSHFMLLGPDTSDVYYKLTATDWMTVKELVKFLGHEGAWFGIPRIPDEYRNPCYRRIWADEVTQKVAAEILLGYKQLVGTRPNIPSLDEVMHGGIEAIKREFSDQITVGKAMEIVEVANS